MIPIVHKLLYYRQVFPNLQEIPPKKFKMFYRFSLLQAVHFPVNLFLHSVFFCVILYVVVILSGGAHGAVGLCKNEYRRASPRRREPRRAEPRAHPLGSGRPERRGAITPLPRWSVPVRTSPVWPARTAARCSRTSTPTSSPCATTEHAELTRGRHPRRADGRLHPPERGRVQGLHLPRLHAG